MTAHDDEQLASGLADLSRFERGAATFAIGPAGEIVYSGTVATVRMHDGERIDQFVERLRRDHDLRHGDTMELLNNGGRLDTARIYKQPRAA